MHHGMYLLIKKNYEEPRRRLIFKWVPLDFVMDIILEILVHASIGHFQKMGF